MTSRIALLARHPSVQEPTTLILGRKRVAAWSPADLEMIMWETENGVSRVYVGDDESVEEQWRRFWRERGCVIIEISE